MSDKASESSLVHCNTCDGERKHAVLNRYDVYGTAGATNEDGDEAAFDLVETLECLGCETITVRRTKWHGVPIERNEEGEIVVADPAVSYLPPRRSRPRPAWIHQIKQRRLRVILVEVYGALEVKAFTLAAMGIRAVVDLVATSIVGDVGNFPTKLDALEQKGWIGGLDKKSLGIVVDAGSAAAHRGFRADEQAINHMMETIEHLLKSRYVLDQQGKVLKRATPKRRKPLKPKR